MLDSVNLFVDSDKSVHIVKGGLSVLKENKPFQNRNIILPVDISRNLSRVVYLKVLTTTSLLVPIDVVLQDEFDFYEMKNLLIWALYYGILFGVFVYNCFLWTREISSLVYFYYLCYIGATAFICTLLNGFAIQHIPGFPHNPKEIADVGVVISSFMMISVLSFTSAFLNIKGHSKVVYGCYIFLVLVLYLFIITVFFIDADINPLNSLVIFVSCFLILGITLYDVALKLPAARLFLFGWSIFLGSTICYILVLFNVIPANTFTIHFKEFAQVVEVLFLSFALANRIKVLILDKNNAIKIRNEALSDAIREKDKFLATISHEINTPLNGIMGPLQNIDYDVLDSGAKTDLLASMESSRELGTLIDRLITISDLRCDRLVLESKRFNFVDTIDQLYSEYRVRSADKNLRFNYIKSKNIPHFVKGDKDKLILLLRQILDNAIKYTSSGGIHFAINKCISGIESQPNSIEFFVSDSGKGFEPSVDLTEGTVNVNLGKLFNAEEGGLGIGLALAKGLAEKMGGFIRPSSRVDTSKEKNYGSLMYVKLILEKSELDEERNKDSLVVSDADETKMYGIARILIVEDNKVNMKIASTFVKKMGYSTVCAEDGQKALDVIEHALRHEETESIDLILMDLQMPTMNGFEATKNIRGMASSKYSEIPIIALTANHESNAKLECEKAGMTAYLKKPIDKNALNAEIEKWLQKSSLIQENQKKMYSTLEGSSDSRPVSH